MTTVVIVVHVIVCLALIIIVLLQAGKGADMGAAFGGASKTVFGPRGAAGPLAKITVGAAVLFMLTCLYLTRATRTPQDSGLNMPTTPTAPAVPGPATKPGGPIAPGPKVNIPGQQGTKPVAVPPVSAPVVPRAPASSPAPAAPLAPTNTPAPPKAP